MFSVSIYTTANLLLIAHVNHTKSTQTKILNEIDVNVICLFSFSVLVEVKVIVSIFGT